MKIQIIRNATYRIVFSLAISLLYMSFLSESYMSLSWPLSFLAILFLAIAWFHYLKNDNIQVQTKFPTVAKKQKKHKSMTDYTDAKIDYLKDFSDEEAYTIKLYSNIITGCILLIISFIV